MNSHSSSDTKQAQLSDSQDASTAPDEDPDKTVNSSTKPTSDADTDNMTRDDDTQVSLMDVSYEGHTAPEPPEDRITDDSVGHDEFYDMSVGDVLWVDGTEYVVVDRPMALINPSPLAVVSADGNQGELVAGKIPNGSGDGVAWKSSLVDKETHEISRSDLLCQYDQLYQLETESLKHVHQWTPDTDHRECPGCADGQNGEPLRIERQASKSVELRRCTDTDCKYMYRFVRDFPEPDTATIVTYDDNDGFGLESVTGVFTCEEQDDFKFPVSTHDGRDDGVFTATEIAAFVNEKMVNPTLASLFEDGTATGEALLDEMEFVTPEETNDFDSNDDDETPMRPVESLVELVELYVEDRQIPFTDSFETAVSQADFPDVFRALMFLRTVVRDKPAYPSEDISDTGLDIDPMDAVDLAVIALTTDSISSEDSTETSMKDALVEAFTGELTAERVLESAVFKELLVDHTESEPFGVVDVKTNRSDELVVEWRDAPGFQKKMRVTYTRIEENNSSMEMFGWYAERHDLSEIAP